VAFVDRHETKDLLQCDGLRLDSVGSTICGIDHGASSRVARKPFARFIARLK
jgi:hypothetical protein